MRAFSLIALASALACGSGGQVDGSVDGVALGKVATAAYVLRGEGGRGTTQLWLTTDDGFCDTVARSIPVKEQHLLFVELFIAAPDYTFVPGDSAAKYEIAPARIDVGSRIADARLLAFGFCASVSHSPLARSGTIDLQHIRFTSDGKVAEVSGTIDATFEKGRLQGHFQGAGCDLANPHLVLCP